MQWKQYCQYQMDFKGRWVQASAAMMGVSFFARMVYYFGIKNIVDCGFLEVIISMILPLILCGGYLVLMSAMKYNAPGIYAMIGAVLCFLLMVEGLCTGNVLRIILSILFYIGAGGVLFITIAGYLPGRLLSSALFAVIFIGRLLFFDLGKLGILEWVVEISVLLMLLSLFFLTRSIQQIPAKTES